MKADIVIVGGAGHIGLPLGMLFANKGKKVILYDKDKKNVSKINNLQMPFMEEGGSKLLEKNKRSINLKEITSGGSNSTKPSFFNQKHPEPLRIFKFLHIHASTK